MNFNKLRGYSISVQHESMRSSADPLPLALVKFTKKQPSKHLEMDLWE